MQLLECIKVLLCLVKNSLFNSSTALGNYGHKPSPGSITLGQSAFNLVINALNGAANKQIGLPLLISANGGYFQFSTIAG
mgnify:CR=1 FL=1